MLTNITRVNFHALNVVCAKVQALRFIMHEWICYQLQSYWISYMMYVSCAWLMFNNTFSNCNSRDNLFKLYNVNSHHLILNREEKSVRRLRLDRGLLK